MNRGFYFVGEGGDGVGKSTQVELLAEYLREEFSLKVLVIHEPSGTPISDEIGKIIKTAEYKRLPLTSLLLFTASRYENWHQLALPVLKRGGIVLSSRNYISSIAYQGIAEGLGADYVKKMTASFMDSRYMSPDLAVLFTIDEDERKKRLEKRGSGSKADTYESRGDDFHSATNQAYDDYAKEEGLLTIDSSGSISKTQKTLRKIVLANLIDKGLNLSQNS